MKRFKSFLTILLWMYMLMNTMNATGCDDKEWCEESIVDDVTAFLVCMQFIEHEFKIEGPYYVPTMLATTDLSGNKCAYRCGKYGYKTNPNCTCVNCVSNYQELKQNSLNMSKKYSETCWENHYFQLTNRTNDICNNNPNQTLGEIDISQTPEFQVVKMCKKYCIENEQCVHLIIDHTKHICKLYKSCRDRKLTAEWDKGRFDHYFLMCPRRGGCDWRYQTAGLYEQNNPNELALTMRIARAPWAPFFPVKKTPVIWAKHPENEACTITNTMNFTNKIVLFEATEVRKAGPTLPYLNFTDSDGKVSKPVPNFCQFADQIMVAQYAGAKAAFIVLKQKFTLTIFDEIENSHLKYRDDAPNKRPNIPAGVIIYDYWDGFQDNENGNMAIGCAVDFDLPQCVPVNYPNAMPGFIVCGCVTPYEVKRYNDPSQVLSLEPCWQMDPRSVGYCVSDAQNCKDFKYHLKVDNKDRCWIYCGGENYKERNCPSHMCQGCPMCGERKLVDDDQDYINKRLKRFFFGLRLRPTIDKYIDRTRTICNNIITKYTFDNDKKHSVWTQCRFKCNQWNNCLYFSINKVDNICYLHAKCELKMMPIEPGWYHLIKMGRSFNDNFLYSLLITESGSNSLLSKETRNDIQKQVKQKLNLKKTGTFYDPEEPRIYTLWTISERLCSNSTFWIENQTSNMQEYWLSLINETSISTVSIEDQTSISTISIENQTFRWKQEVVNNETLLGFTDWLKLNPLNTGVVRPVHVEKTFRIRLTLRCQLRKYGEEGWNMFEDCNHLYHWCAGDKCECQHNICVRKNDYFNDNGTWYLPFIQEKGKTLEDNPNACRQRCLDIPECWYFNYFPNRECQVSGNDAQSHWNPTNPTVATGAVRGLMYLPWDLPEQEGTNVGNSDECRQRCLDIPECWYFNYFSNGECHVSGSYARPHWNENNPTDASGAVRGVPHHLYPRIPTIKKCWYRTQGGNGKCDVSDGKFVLDTWGRDNYNAFASESNCFARKTSIDSRCAVNSEFCYKATKEECEVLYPHTPQDANAPTTSMTTPNPTIRPINKKCWTRFSKGNGKCGRGTWGKFVQDHWGKNNGNSFESESKCLARKRGTDAFCGTDSTFCYKATKEECEVLHKRSLETNDDLREEGIFVDDETNDETKERNLMNDEDIENPDVENSVGVFSFLDYDKEKKESSSEHHPIPQEY